MNAWKVIQMIINVKMEQWKSIIHDQTRYGWKNPIKKLLGKSNTKDLLIIMDDYERGDYTLYNNNILVSLVNLRKNFPMEFSTKVVSTQYAKPHQLTKKEDKLSHKEQQSILELHKETEKRRIRKESFNNLMAFNVYLKKYNLSVIYGSINYPGIDY